MVVDNVPLLNWIVLQNPNA